MTTDQPHEADRVDQADPRVGGLLRYRLLTGTDDRAFCEKVSAALAQGYVLHGSPAIAFDGGEPVTAQAVVLP